MPFIHKLLLTTCLLTMINFVLSSVQCYFCHESVLSEKSPKYANCLAGGEPTSLEDPEVPVLLSCNRYCVTARLILSGSGKTVEISKGCGDSPYSYCLRKMLKVSATEWCFRVSYKDFVKAQDRCKEESYVVGENGVGLHNVTKILPFEEEVSRVTGYRDSNSVILDCEYCECEEDYCNSGKDKGSFERTGAVKGLGFTRVGDTWGMIFWLTGTSVYFGFARISLR